MGSSGAASDPFQSLLLVEPPLESFEDELSDADTSIIGIHPFDDVPRRVSRTGPHENSLGRAHEIVVHLPMFPVAFRNAPLLKRIFLKRPEAFLLLISTEMHPELEHERPIVGERLLEGDDVLELRIELLQGCFSISVVEERFVVPRAQEESDVPLRGKSNQKRQ